MHREYSSLHINPPMTQCHSDTRRCHSVMAVFAVPIEIISWLILCYLTCPYQDSLWIIYIKSTMLLGLLYRICYMNLSPSTTVDLLQLHSSRTFSKPGNRQLSCIMTFPITPTTMKDKKIPLNRQSHSQPMEWLSCAGSARCNSKHPRNALTARQQHQNTQL